MKIKQNKSTYYVSPVWAALLVLALILCGAAAYYYFTTSSGNQKMKVRLGASIKSHQTAVNSMTRDFSDSKAQQMRDRTTKIKEAMKSGDEVDRFVASLRPAWSVVSKSEETNEEYVRRRYQIARGSVPVSAWPEILGVVDQMKAIQSLALSDVDILTVGDNKKREFSRITLSFVIYVKKPE